MLQNIRKNVTIQKAWGIISLILAIASHDIALSISKFRKSPAYLTDRFLSFTSMPSSYVSILHKCDDLKSGKFVARWKFRRVKTRVRIAIEVYSGTKNCRPSSDYPRESTPL